MIIPWFLHLTAQFSLFLKFCLEKNKGHPAVTYYNLNAIVPFIKAPHPINNLIKITDPTQAITLNVLLFDIWLTCSAWCLFQPSPPKGHTPFPGCPWGTVTALPSHATLADKILTIATFLQEHRYPITLMMSSSKEIHSTCSHFFTKTLFGC